MATELKTNGAAAEYSPNKSELLNGGGNSGDDGHKERYTKKDVEGEEERIPLKSPIDAEKAAQTDDAGAEDVKDSVSLSSGKKKKKKKERCALRGISTLCTEKLQLTTKRSRLIAGVLLFLCVVLFVAVIVMAICWPRVEDYMLEDVCVDKDCIDASAQILQFANTTIKACENPYGFVCDNFGREYVMHEAFGLIRGEWNFRANADYDEVKNLHTFISRMDEDGGATYSARSKMRILHRYCMNIENSDTHSSLIKAFHYLHGVHYLSTMSPHWDFRDSLTVLQSRFGPAPFFRITVEDHLNSNTGEYSGKIIVIGEGDLSLPSRMFYKLNVGHPIVSAFKDLLSDIAQRLGVLRDRAQLFADEVFHYEQRIVGSMSVVESKKRNLNTVMRLDDVKKLTPSLPILSTITALFPNVKITELTHVMVKDIEVLQSMSTIVSTTDDKVLNTFLAWSLIRSYLPFLPHGFRSSLEFFEKILYKTERAPPNWYFCAKLVKTWMPLAVDVLQNYPDIQKTKLPGFADITTTQDTAAAALSNKLMDHISGDIVDNTGAYLRLIFNHIRNEIKKSINNANWINENLSAYLVERLSKTKLQIGFSDRVVSSEEFINSYYEDFLVQFHSNNLVSRWDFLKRKMEHSLHNGTDRDEWLISKLYPNRMDGNFDKDGNSNERNDAARFHGELNTVIISRNKLKAPYFSKGFPISVNFGRIGKDISDTLLTAVDVFNNEYLNLPAISKRNISVSSNTVTNIRYIPYDNDVIGSSKRCILNKLRLGDPNIPEQARNNLYNYIRVARITARALGTLLWTIDQGKAVIGMDDGVTYASLGLTTRLRQPGLRALDERQLFTVTYLQNFCADPENNYDKLKPYIEMEVSGRTLFESVWRMVEDIPHQFDCDEEIQLCNDLL